MRMTMISYENDKRIRPRMKQEFAVGVRTERGLNVAYVIDISRVGVKVGSPLLLLPLGGQVVIEIDKRGGKFPFSGRVASENGDYYISRISRSVNTYFISIDDEQYVKFAIENYFV
jgi:PilZ domain-containing protein